MSTVISRAFLALGLTFVLLAATAPPARADATSEAREHYQKGTSFYDLGKYNDAVREFEAAYQIKNDPALLYNLAQSHRQAGNSEQALHFYRTYLRRVPKAPNRAEIEGRIAQLEQLVAQKNAAQTAPPNVTMPPAETAPTTPSPPPAANLPPPMPPPVTMAPPPEAAPPTSSAPVYVTSERPEAARARGALLKKIGKYTLIGGGVFFLAGAIIGSRANGAANEVNDTAAMGGTFDPAVESRGKAYATAGNSLILVGVLAGGAGAGLYFYGRHKEKAATVTATPLASAGMLGGSLRVTF
jgi:tetratricopeptide (TPR) repeat protein